MFHDVFYLCLYLSNKPQILSKSWSFLKFAVGSCDPTGPRSDNCHQGWNLGVRSTQVKVSPSILSGLLTRSFSLLDRASVRVHMQRSMRGSKAHLFELPSATFWSSIDFLLVEHLFDAGIGRYKNQNVAIKIVHKGDTPEEVTKREGRFLREVTMLSRVQHKNLVKVCFCSIKSILSSSRRWPRERKFLMHLCTETMPAWFTVYRSLPATCHGGGDGTSSWGLVAEILGQSQAQEPWAPCSSGLCIGHCQSYGMLACTWDHSSWS